MNYNGGITVVGGVGTTAGVAVLPETSGSPLLQALSLVAIGLGVLVLVTGILRARASKA